MNKSNVQSFLWDGESLSKIKDGVICAVTKKNEKGIYQWLNKSESVKNSMIVFSENQSSAFILKENLRDGSVEKKRNQCRLSFAASGQHLSDVNNVVVDFIEHAHSREQKTMVFGLNKESLQELQKAELDLNMKIISVHAFEESLFNGCSNRITPLDQDSVEGFLIPGQSKSYFFVRKGHELQWFTLQFIQKSNATQIMHTIISTFNQQISNKPLNIIHVLQSKGYDYWDGVFNDPSWKALMNSWCINYSLKNFTDTDESIFSILALRGDSFSKVNFWNQRDFNFSYLVKPMMLMTLVITSFALAGEYIHSSFKNKFEKIENDGNYSTIKNYSDQIKKEREDINLQRKIWEEKNNKDLTAPTRARAVMESLNNFSSPGAYLSKFRIKWSSGPELIVQGFADSRQDAIRAGDSLKSLEKMGITGAFELGWDGEKWAFSIKQDAPDNLMNIGPNFKYSSSANLPSSIPYSQEKITYKNERVK